MATTKQLAPWIETGIRAGVSEIQRRNRERDYVLEAPTFSNRDRGPAVTTEEMLKVLREFLESAQEGLG